MGGEVTEGYKEKGRVAQIVEHMVDNHAVGSASPPSLKVVWLMKLRGKDLVLREYRDGSRGVQRERKSRRKDVRRRSKGGRDVMPEGGRKVLMKRIEIEGRKLEHIRSKESGMAGYSTEVVNRCVESGHGRSVRGWFRKTGRRVRERARIGKLEGVYRVSW